MRFSLILRVAAVTLSVFLLSPAASPASAQPVSVDININVGSSLNFGRGITCSEGAWILRNRGFRDVRSVDCRGRYFIYRASRSGWRFEVAIRSRDGRVVDFRRIRRI
jgi:hypothetical protein